MVMLISFVILSMVYAMRQGKSAMGSKPSTVQSFVTTMPVNEVLKVVLACVQQKNYDIEDIDEANGCVILGERSTNLSFGIYITSTATGTVVEIGARSKMGTSCDLFGLLHSARNRLFNAIKAAVTARCIS